LAKLAAFLVDFFCESFELLGCNLSIQRLVLVRPKDLREIVWQKSADKEIGVSNSQRATLPVTGRSGMCGS
jgi:hypothetical protein